MTDPMGGGSSLDSRLQQFMILFATVMGVLFIVLGFLVFFGGWSAAGTTTDDGFLQLLLVGQGALPYFIGGALFWLLAEYKTAHGG
jgi:hypothetical protein